ncbi:ABC transporter substrate-binding protein [Ancylobacter dichloromethanicus]|uniref:ABC transporter substrate-binding protein n=1 Tax=Ancylobacter dichloromethanicus TaxID=518825 RepID=A0A9W6N157_9HYPH|nr:ABC transporter substrate-binding protein [Ancylobacter dichloromethanicus]MBS7555191.1 ABC transporter substrate-binding protein [Ancylobacter dichloromethanicus]GLK73692.1 ABC transporter substrate-binding protein [Ancylobacter dichloromethanicus]
MKNAGSIAPLSRRTLLAGAVGLLAAPSVARVQSGPPLRLRVGTLKFGTLNWLVETIRAEGLDTGEGLALERVDFASGQATTVALQADDVDLIVSDWLWAMRRTSDGERMRFAPFSNALGALMAAADGPVKTLADLRGRRIGVAGGALDKSWLLLRAYSKAKIGVDLASAAEPVYGAPPLVSEQLPLGRVDAVLTFWPYAARLDARGFARLMDVREMITGLGIEPVPPLVGFVWRNAAMAERGAAVAAFLRAAAGANRVLASSDAAWARIRPLMQAANDTEFTRLRDYYRAGIPGPFGEAERASCAKLYEVLAAIGGPELVGPTPGFDRTLFGPVGE